MLASLVRFSNT